MLLAVVSNSAMAEWVYVAEDEEETFAIYVDPSTIQKHSQQSKNMGSGRLQDGSGT